MKGSQFTERQIAFAAHQADPGTPAAGAVPKVTISERTFCRWKKKSGGLTPSEVRRLKQWVDENSRLLKRSHFEGAGWRIFGRTSSPRHFLNEGGIQ